MTACIQGSIFKFVAGAVGKSLGVRISLNLNCTGPEN